MAGPAAGNGDHGGQPVHGPGQDRGQGVGNKHRARGDVVDVQDGRGEPDHAGGAAARGPHAAAQKRRGRAGRPDAQGRLGQAVGLGLHGHGPGLENKRRAVLVDGPFHVLGRAKGFFQTQGQGGQAAGRFLGEHLAVQGLAVEEKMGRIVGQGQAFRAGRAFDQGPAQARHGVDGHGRFGIGAVAGVEHARGGGRHHGQHEHGHGRFLVGVAGEHPVGDGLGRVFAGQDPQVGGHGVFRFHAKQALVLAGKRGPAVLGHGRAAKGQQHGLASRAASQPPGRLGQGHGHFVRHPGGEQEFPGGGGGLGHLARPGQVHPAQDAVDGRAQFAGFKQIAEGPGGGHEALRGRNPGLGHGPGQVGGLAAGPGHVAGQLGQGQDKRRRHVAGRQVQGHLDVEIDLAGVLGQVEVSGRRQAGHALHELIHGSAQPPGQMDHPGPVHGRAAVMDVLQGGDEFQAGVVVAQKLPEGVVLLAQQHARGKDLIGPTAEKLLGKHDVSV